MKKVKIMSAAVTTLAVALLAAQPAAAAPVRERALRAQVSCQVTTQWTCKTAPIWVGNAGIIHLATTGIPVWSESGWGDSFLLLRDLDAAGDPEIWRSGYKYSGAEHDYWLNVQPNRTYRGELHCPWSCQGAVLYVGNS
jgi:hypothetical protein